MFLCVERKNWLMRSFTRHSRNMEHMEGDPAICVREVQSPKQYALSLGRFLLKLLCDNYVPMLLCVERKNWLTRSFTRHSRNMEHMEGDPAICVREVQSLKQYALSLGRFLLKILCGNYMPMILCVERKNWLTRSFTRHSRNMEHMEGDPATCVRESPRQYALSLGRFLLKLLCGNYVPMTLCVEKQNWLTRSFTTQ